MRIPEKWSSPPLKRLIGWEQNSAYAGRNRNLTGGDSNIGIAAGFLSGIKILAPSPPSPMKGSTGFSHGQTQANSFLHHSLDNRDCVRVMFH